MEVFDVGDPGFNIAGGVGDQGLDGVVEESYVVELVRVVRQIQRLG